MLEIIQTVVLLAIVLGLMIYVIDTILNTCKTIEKLYTQVEYIRFYIDDILDKLSIPNSKSYDEVYTDEVS